MIASSTLLYKNALAGNVTAQIFWLKNRRPAEWRDVQNIEANHAHYIVADHPMTEEQWIAERADSTGHRGQGRYPRRYPGRGGYS